MKGPPDSVIVLSRAVVRCSLGRAGIARTTPSEGVDDIAAQELDTRVMVLLKAAVKAPEEEEEEYVATTTADADAIDDVSDTAAIESAERAVLEGDYHGAATTLSACFPRFVSAAPAFARGGRRVHSLAFARSFACLDATARELEEGTPELDDEAHATLRAGFHCCLALARGAGGAALPADLRPSERVLAVLTAIATSGLVW